MGETVDKLGIAFGFLKSSFIAFVALVLAWLSFQSFRGAGIEDLQTMLNDSTSTIAVMDSVYQISTGKLGTSYEVTCIYQVEGKEYRTPLTVDEDPGSDDFLPIFRIYYLKSDPSVICRDPEKEIAKKEADSGSIFYLVLTIGCGLFGVIMALSAIGKFKILASSEN